MEQEVHLSERTRTRYLGTKECTEVGVNTAHTLTCTLCEPVVESTRPQQRTSRARLHKRSEQPYKRCVNEEEVGHTICTKAG